MRRAVDLLPPKADCQSVVAYSTGNFGRAIAHVASLADIPATVCVSERVTEDKINAERESGCALHVEGGSQDEAAEIEFRLQREHGTPLIDPINDRNVLTGQAPSVSNCWRIGACILERAPHCGRCWRDSDCGTLGPRAR